jgi:Domain of unknown function (DUF4333)
MVRRSALLALPAVLALGLAGCGTLDQDQLEDEVQKAVEQASQNQIKVKDVSCPGDRELKKGDTFTCKVTAENGAIGSARVTQRDDDGHVSITPSLGPLLAGPS